MTALCFLLGGACVATLAWAIGERRRARRCEAERAALWEHERESLRLAADETEEHLTAILSSMEEGVMVVDTSHIIRLANPSLQRLFALKSPPTGQTVLAALRLPLLESMLHEALASNRPQQEEMTVPLTPGHLPLHLIVSTTPFQGADGVLGGIAVFRDVSRLRKLEELRREFVANVSHELRTPLSIFHGHLENLLDQEEFPPDELRPILAVMRKHSLRLNALVEDLLTLTRLESRRDPLKREPLALPAFFADLETDWQNKVGGKSIVFTTEVADGTPLLFADPHRLRQVLDNLLDNAVKYTPVNGAIGLRARPAGDLIELRLSDSGAGIPPGDLPHIFERFYRADKARSRELGGTGLGLSIVKHIVLAHGGSVAAESTVGKGTTVALTFPKEGETSA